MAMRGDASDIKMILVIGSGQGMRKRLGRDAYEHEGPVAEWEMAKWVRQPF
jgi:hypothetical protein